MTKSRKPGPDARFHSAIGQVTGGLSPTALATAYLDWALHLFGSPEKQAELARLWVDPSSPAWHADANGRFADAAWQVPPYKAMTVGFLAAQTWWNAATSGIKGVDPKHADIVNFAARQWLDMMSPANFAWTNPLVTARTQQEKGRNLIRGARYWIEDFNRLITQSPRPATGYEVGGTLAVTPGDVVLRNDLIELIRYRPTTARVRPEPILIVPAWIMKYYILDLTEQRSLVAFLRDQGFEVYIVSWKNPDAGDADLGMQDYVDQGVRESLTYIAGQGAKRVHLAGYCLGGTLVSIAAAAIARDGQDTLASISLLASQVDFSEPGELGLFINESQVAFLEDLMATQGYLKSDQMAGAFRMLRSNDLIWSRVIRHYLLGERTPENPLMAWNADATRMPARMHSEYLRRLFLNNDLAKGRYRVDDATVALTDIRNPIYCVGTEEDHVSPWRSVYRLLLLTDTDVDFVLTNGGHNGGILSEPGHSGRHFRARSKTEQDRHMTAQQWFDESSPRDGSWWPHWASWLKRHSGKPIAPRALTTAPVQDAPGRYVFG